MPFTIHFAREVQRVRYTVSGPVAARHGFPPRGFRSEPEALAWLMEG